MHLLLARIELALIFEPIKLADTPNRMRVSAGSGRIVRDRENVRPNALCCAHPVT